MTDQKTALDGIRVIDMGRYQAGPRAGLVLARLGAEVIKVEALNGEESRSGSPNVRGQSAYWVQYNSGKKSLALDLRREKAKEILRDLAKISDIFIQNFRPGVIDKIGFSYDVLRGLNPGIIMLNVSAYGQYGPYKDRVGFDTIGQAISGFMSITGYPENPPTRAGSPVIDRITSLHGTIGVLAALRERDISGKGQSIDVCLADTGFSLTEIPVAAYLGNGEEAERTGNFRKGSYAGAFKTMDGWVALVGAGQNVWERLCKAIGNPEWIEDPRFAERKNREDNIDQVQNGLTKWFSTKTMEEAVDILSDNSVPCTWVNDIAQASKNPHLWARNCLVEVSDPIAGTIHVSGDYIKLSRSRTVVGAVPAVGEHNDEILNELLNYTPEKIQQMRDEMIIR